MLLLASCGKRFAFTIYSERRKSFPNKSTTNWGKINVVDYINKNENANRCGGINPKILIINSKTRRQTAPQKIIFLMRADYSCM